MKFRTLDSFKSDYKKLKPEHKDSFRMVVVDMSPPACDAGAAALAARRAYVWPASLRVDEMRRAPGIMEMTWSFASPDGRATFQFLHLDGEWSCVWRRIGKHSVYVSP